MAAFCTGCRINKAIGQIFAQKRIITLCKPIQANDMPNHSQEMLIARHLVDFLSSRASCEPAAHLRCSLAAQLSAFSLGADARILAYFAAALLVHCEYELKCARIGSKLPNLCSGCYAATSIQWIDVSRRSRPKGGEQKIARKGPANPQRGWPKASRRSRFAGMIQGIRIATAFSLAMLSRC